MIQELMIINQAGIALFYYNISGKKISVDQQSLAAYFDLICRFTKSKFKESLRILTLDNYVFFFFSHESGLHIIFKCDKQIFDKESLEKLAKILIEKFLEEYKDKLTNFNGEISPFYSFSDNVLKLLDLIPKKAIKTPIQEH
jgi:hypothetical protein